MMIEDEDVFDQGREANKKKEGDLDTTKRSKNIKAILIDHERMTEQEAISRQIYRSNEGSTIQGGLLSRVDTGCAKAPRNPTRTKR